MLMSYEENNLTTQKLFKKQLKITTVKFLKYPKPSAAWAENIQCLQQWLEFAKRTNSTIFDLLQLEVVPGRGSSTLCIKALLSSSVQIFELWKWVLGMKSMAVHTFIFKYISIDKMVATQEGGSSELTNLSEQ